MSSSPDQSDPTLYDLTVSISTQPQLVNAEYFVAVITSSDPSGSQPVVQYMTHYTTDAKGADTEILKVPTTVMSTAAQSQGPLTVAANFPQNGGPTCYASYTIQQVPAS